MSTIRSKIFAALVGPKGEILERTLDQIAAGCTGVDVKKIRSGIYPMAVEELVGSRRDEMNRVLFFITMKGRERMENPGPARRPSTPSAKDSAPTPAVKNEKRMVASASPVGFEYHSDGTLILWNGSAEVVFNKAQALPVIRFVAGQLNYAEKLGGNDGEA